MIPFCIWIVLQFLLARGTIRAHKAPVRALLVMDPLPAGLTFSSFISPFLAGIVGAMPVNDSTRLFVVEVIFGFGAFFLSIAAVLQILFWFNIFPTRPRWLIPGYVVRSES